MQAPSRPTLALWLHRLGAALRIPRRTWLGLLPALLPLALLMLHALGVWRIGMVQQLDNSLYDLRLHLARPRPPDSRIVIVNIDEKSLATVGRWPWPRDTLGQLVDALFEQQKIALLGFNMVFAEPNSSATTLPSSPKRADPPDAVLAKALKNRPVVMGYYFTNTTNTSEARTSGSLPPPLLQPWLTQAPHLQDATLPATHWSGYGANLALLREAAPTAGFLNSVVDADGVVRCLPLIAEYQDNHYESLALAMFRLAAGATDPPSLPNTALGTIDQLQLQQREGLGPNLALGENALFHIPFRTNTTTATNHPSAFQTFSAADILTQRTPPDSLKNKIVLLGTAAPGLVSLQATPLSKATLGVEIQAHALSALLDGQQMRKPDYAQGYEVIMLCILGALLAWGLPVVSTLGGMALNATCALAILGLNLILYAYFGLVMPMASALLLIASAFFFNLGLGYFLEHHAKRSLIWRFGTYVPPELVKEMAKNPSNYQLQASNQNLTVMFCDIRDFSNLSEHMEPTRLQALLTGIFNRLTHSIHTHRGTIDKYMGDCVMAFWGAPTPAPAPGHAHLAVQSALDMLHTIHTMNQEHRRQGLPEIAVGIGLHTGIMCVGDMGSNIRRSYTVIGAAVNLGARIENLCKTYGVAILASAATRAQAPQFIWQEIDRVHVKGTQDSITIYQPLCHRAHQSPRLRDELTLWQQCLDAYRAQDWDTASTHLNTLRAQHPTTPSNALYKHYAHRIQTLRHPAPNLSAPDPNG